jgi:hypothetical protein
MMVPRRTVPPPPSPQRRTLSLAVDWTGPRLPLFESVPAADGSRSPGAPRPCSGGRRRTAETESEAGGRPGKRQRLLANHRRSTVVGDAERGQCAASRRIVLDAVAPLRDEEEQELCDTMRRSAVLRRHWCAEPASTTGGIVSPQANKAGRAVGLCKQHDTPARPGDSGGISASGSSVVAFTCSRTANLRRSLSLGSVSAGGKAADGVPVVRAFSLSTSRSEHEGFRPYCA